MQRVGGREPMRRRARPLLRRDREPAQDPQRAADPARRRAALLHGRGPRAHPRRARLGRARRTPATRCSTTASSTRCCSPTSTSTTRRCSSCCRWSTATSPCAIDGTVAARAGRRRARRWSRSRPATYEIGAAADGFAYDNERPRHAVELGGVRDRPHPGHQRRLRRVRRRHRRRAADVLGARRRRLGDARPSGAASRSTRRMPVVHVDWHQADAFAALGRQAAADRARVGGGGGRRRPRARQPRPARLRLRARPAPTATPPPTAARCRCSATSGSGRRSDFAGYPGFSAFPYPEYSEVFFGDDYKVLRGGAWATRRDVIRTELSQLGPARALTDLLRPALRKGRVDGRRPAEQIEIEVHLPEGGTLAGPGRGRPRGPLVPVQGDAAEVLLRRARLGAVRGDHRAARVLPDPGRALDPRPRRRRDRRRREPDDADRARLRRRREDPLPARRDARRRARSRPTSRSTSPRRSPAGSPTSWSPSTRACACTGSSATTRPTSSASRARRAR